MSVNLNTIWVMIAAIMTVLFIFGKISKNQKEKLQDFKNRGILPVSGDANFEHVKRLADLGEKIMAIKIYRKLTGAGLKQAKEQVENYLSIRQLNETSQIMSNPLVESSKHSFDQIKKLADDGRVIDAIKNYRALKNCGLKEAKDAIDHYLETGNIS